MKKIYRLYYRRKKKRWRKKNKIKNKFACRFKRLRFRKCHYSLQESYLNEIKEIQNNTFHTLRCYALEIIINWDIFEAIELKLKSAQISIRSKMNRIKKMES